MKVKATSCAKKKKTDNQLPITIWCTPKKIRSLDNVQIEADYKLALELQQSWRSK